MQKTSFGERLRIAFNNASNAEIARKIGVSSSGVVNYLAGRIPDIDKLERIKALTNCDLDWLLTGDESRNVKPLPIKPEIAQRLETIAHEQSDKVFGDLDIAAATLDAQALGLLVNFLLDKALSRYGLVDGSLLTAADRKRTDRFTFIANAPASIEDQVRELITREVSGKSVSSVAQTEEFRDMIRELIREVNAESRKRPVFPLVLADADENEEEATRRKTG